jgi:acetyl CoA:N6-hydroxylysine acetyl transferase
MPATETPASLFCKPLFVSPENEILYQSIFTDPDLSVSFRSLSLSSDLDMIYDWVNRDYSKEFWQLHGTKQLVRNTYSDIIKSLHSHSFIGLLNDDPICQVDIYQVLHDELALHADPEPNDCGMHFIMAPPEQRKKGTSLLLFKSFLSFYFSFPCAQRMFGEPDQGNVRANKLVIDAGFQFLKTIQLSYKTANLYSLSRTKFMTPNS